MASLREVKDHIESVRSTLKSTSAMKLVSSAKLHKAQQMAENIRPYTEALAEILSAVSAHGAGVSGAGVHGADLSPRDGRQTDQEAAGAGRVAIVAVSSNSSLCGAFNINVIRKSSELIESYKKQGSEVEVYPIGRKMAEAMRRAGYTSPEDYSDMVGKCSFEKASAFAQKMIDAYNSGRYTSVMLVYNHFVSTSTQKVYVEEYLGASQAAVQPSSAEDSGEFIIEPSRDEVLSVLQPQVMRLRIYTMLLDSIASEHAARMVAMQAASDNAEELLDTLTLEYNKGRQAKITSEILDLVGGSQQ